MTKKRNKLSDYSDSTLLYSATNLHSRFRRVVKTAIKSHPLGRAPLPSPVLVCGSIDIIVVEEGCRDVSREERVRGIGDWRLESTGQDRPGLVPAHWLGWNAAAAGRWLQLADLETRTPPPPPPPPPPLHLHQPPLPPELFVARLVGWLEADQGEKDPARPAIINVFAGPQTGEMIRATS